MKDGVLYRFPGLRLTLHAPSDWMDPVDSVYRNFRSPSFPFPEEEAFVAVDRLPEGGFRWATSLGGGRQGTWPATAGPAALLGLFQNAVMTRCARARLFHAAAVARHGRATLVAAPSNLGKTTLCAALVRAGWDFLSDEAAVLPPEGTEVLAFPRAVSLRLSSLDLLGLADLAPRAQDWDGERRVVLDAGELRPGCRAARATLHRVVFLRAPAAAPPPELGDAEFMEIDTAGCPESFLMLLEAEAGILRAERLTDRPGAVVRIAHRPGAAVSAAVDVCARREGVRVTAHVRACTAPLRHDHPPRLRPLEPLEGARRLLGHLINGRALAASRPLAILLAELAAQVAGVRFFELIPGPLGKTVELLSDP